MDPIQVKDIVLKINNFNSDRNWSQFHSIKNLSSALTVEASELLEIFQWMKEEDSNDVSKDELLKSRVEEELADIFMYLLQIAHKTEINLAEAVARKMLINEAKYPVDKSRGNALKYTEFKKQSDD